MDTQNNDVLSCRFNDGVICGRHICRKCGWNPVESKRRIETLHEQMNAGKEKK